MAKVALCVIATSNYINFVPPLLESAEAFFLKGHEVDYHVFSDGAFITGYFNLAIHEVEHKPWPQVTLKRYHIMAKANLLHYDYVYYIDADMLFVAPVGDEIFAPLLGVQHPGFFNGGGGWENNRNSNAWMPDCKRKNYIAGGFQGGSDYVKMFPVLKQMIGQDIENGCVARWNDESYWNRLKSLMKSRFKILSPAYCMVEEVYKRELWGIYHLEPKIIALSKEHSKYQI